MSKIGHQKVKERIFDLSVSPLMLQRHYAWLIPVPPIFFATL